MKKVCLCLAFVLAAVCILCSCSDLPAPSTSETVNPSVDVTLKKWEDCGASIDKAEEISGIKFGESLKNIVSVRAIPYTAIEVVCSLDKSASDNTVTLRKAVSYAVKNSENLSGVNTNGLSPTMATFEIKGANLVNEKGETVVGEYNDNNYKYSFYCKKGLNGNRVYYYIKKMITE